MKRRNFAVTTALAASAAATVKAMGKPGSKAGKEFYELRRYLLDDAGKQKALEAFLRDVEIPALNRLGISPVGVFKVLEGEDLTLFMLIPFKSLESFVGLTDSLEADPVYMKDGEAVLTAGKKDPAFLRIESALLEAFDRFPKLVAPEKKDTRVYELRQYESSSFVLGKNKVDMFNNAGEIDVFEETGLSPVFFGETLIGNKVPNLTYMVTFADMAAHDANWEKFKKHPVWQRIKNIPKYKGTVSNITKTFLKATAYSQI